MLNNQSGPNIYGTTTWMMILVIILGLLTGIFKSDLTTWGLFAFLCVFGIFVFAFNSPRRQK